MSHQKTSCLRAELSDSRRAGQGYRRDTQATSSMSQFRNDSFEFVRQVSAEASADAGRRRLRRAGRHACCRLRIRQATGAGSVGRQLRAAGIPRGGAARARGAERSRGQRGQDRAHRAVRAGAVGAAAAHREFGDDASGLARGHRRQDGDQPSRLRDGAQYRGVAGRRQRLQGARARTGCAGRSRTRAGTACAWRCCRTCWPSAWRTA